MNENPFMDWIGEQNTKVADFAERSKQNEFTSGIKNDLSGGASRAFGLLSAGGYPVNYNPQRVTEFAMQQIMKEGSGAEGLYDLLGRGTQKPDPSYQITTALRNPAFRASMMPAGTMQGGINVPLAELIARVMGTSMMNTSPELFQWLSPEYRPPNPDRA